MLASRAKSESFAYSGGWSRTTGNRKSGKGVGETARERMSQQNTGATPTKYKKEKQRKNIHNQKDSVTKGQWSAAGISTAEVYRKDMNQMVQESNTARTISVMRTGPLSWPFFLAPWKYKNVRSILQPAKQKLKLGAELTPVILRTPSMLAKTK